LSVREELAIQAESSNAQQERLQSQIAELEAQNGQAQLQIDSDQGKQEEMQLKIAELETQKEQQAEQLRSAEVEVQRASNDSAHLKVGSPAYTGP